MTTGPPQIRVRGRLIRVGSLESDGFHFLVDPSTLLANARSPRSPLDLFTFVQTLPHTQPRFDYPMEWDNFAALPVSSFDHWFTRQIDRKTRNMVRKGEKSRLVVREVAFDDTFVKGISAMYNECPVRQGKPFWHYGKDVETVRRENATFLDDSILIGAFVDESLVGFAKLVLDRERQQARVMQILSLMKHRDKAPTNALIAQAVRSCAERGVPFLVYSSFSYGKKLRDGLADFKLSNGFQRVEIPRYYVPLTLRGRVAMRLGFHHRLAERVPWAILARVQRTRAFWYERKLRVHRTAS